MLDINFTGKDFAIADLENRIWRSANSAAINKYWSAVVAPPERHAAARLLWSDKFLYSRFDCIQKEPIVINEDPDLEEKTIGLWDRDVCELFIAPDPENTDHYFEFEVAPTGEWVDLEIFNKGGDRETLSGYRSKMESAASISDSKLTIAMKIPFEALRATPKDGDIWRGNLFRIIGEGPERGYLSWRPTKTAEPNFHVPGRFGEFRFKR
ncbi:MAG: carbohydrate-binding family 9-like protein [Acidobacteria bacterium]|nr:carbohydrate-binding family 9-like protein [Acidobacteriota bacterium]